MQKLHQIMSTGHIKMKIKLTMKFDSPVHEKHQDLPRRDFLQRNLCNWKNIVFLI